jgi:hypothetical protein
MICAAVTNESEIRMRARRRRWDGAGLTC